MDISVISLNTQNYYLITNSLFRLIETVSYQVNAILNEYRLYDKKIKLVFNFMEKETVSNLCPQMSGLLFLKYSDIYW